MNWNGRFIFFSFMEKLIYKSCATPLGRAERFILFYQHATPTGSALLSIGSYSDSATTSLTSGTSCFNNLSIPDFKVTVDDGQPLQEPFITTVTIPSSNDLK